MAKIDTSGWREFRVGDLFDVQYGKHIPKSAEVSKQNGFPHITTSQYDNGVGYYVADKMFDGNAISVASDGCQGMSFYHDYPFSASNIVSVLTPHENVLLNYYNATFLCTLFRAEGKKYSWGGFKFSVDRVRETRLLLPSTPSGAPDWTYMENCMKLIENNVLARLKTLEAAKETEKKKIDTSEWKEFRVGDLFEISTSKSVDKINLDFIESGKYDFIGRTPINNGIQGHLNKLDFDPNPSCTFSVTQIGERLCQYRENEWYASQNIFILNPKHTEIKRVPLFFTTVITEMLKRKYGDDAYSCYPTLKSLPQCTILLPVTPSGDPDWVYMENYMRSIENRVRASEDALLR